MYQDIPAVEAKLIDLYRNLEKLGVCRKLTERAAPYLVNMMSAAYAVETITAAPIVFDTDLGADLIRLAYCHEDRECRLHVFSDRSGLFRVELMGGMCLFPKLEPRPLAERRPLNNPPIFICLNPTRDFCMTGLVWARGNIDISLKATG